MHADRLTDRMQHILDRLLVLDAVCLSGPGGTELQSMRLLLTDLESLATATGSGRGIEDHIQQCKERMKVLDHNNSDAGGMGMVSSAEAAPVIACLADTARILLRNMSNSDNDGGSSLLNRLVLATPAVLLGLFLLVYFYNGMVVQKNSMQIYWHGPDQTYSEGDSKRQCAVMDGQWQSYDIAFDRTGVTQVRMDPAVDGTLMRRTEVRRIAFYDDKHATWRDVVPGQWACENCRLKVTEGILEIAADGADPWVVLPPVTEGAVSRVLVEARITPARLWPWRWLQIYVGNEKLNTDCP